VTTDVCFAASVIVTWHLPAATDVTANVALGPTPFAGENVATPLQSELVAVNAPEYPASVAATDCAYRVAVN
jgi:uncharacterized protein (DUF697 family)